MKYDPWGHGSELSMMFCNKFAYPDRMKLMRMMLLW